MSLSDYVKLPTAGEIAETGQKTVPYLYGNAHATGIGNQAMPNTLCSWTRLKTYIRWKTVPSKHSTFHRWLIFFNLVLIKTNKCLMEFRL